MPVKYSCQLPDCVAAYYAQCQRFQFDIASANHNAKVLTIQYHCQLFTCHYICHNTRKYIWNKMLHSLQFATYTGIGIKHLSECVRVIRLVARVTGSKLIQIISSATENDHWPMSQCSESMDQDCQLIDDSQAPIQVNVRDQDAEI